jgi:hypothetical protein
MPTDRLSRVRRRVRPRRDVCRVEACEARTLLAVFAVTTVADAGPGSLRQAILDANAAEGADEIHFDLGGSGVRTIAPASPLPAAWVPVTIDGTTQPGYAGTPLVQIDGAAAGPAADGLVLRYEPVPAGTQPPRGPGEVRGLAVIRFGGSGVVAMADDVTVRACRVGVNAADDAARPNGTGVLVLSSNVLVGGPSAADANVLSGHAGAGVRVAFSPGSSLPANVVVQGNAIGTDASGSLDLGNGGDGVTVDEGTVSVLGNVISGNGRDGVRGEVQSRLRVEGNSIGTNRAGSAALANVGSGVFVGGNGGTIGGAAAGQGNVISGNGGPGVRVDHTGTSGSADFAIRGNAIGTDAAGAVAIGNGAEGVLIEGQGPGSYAYNEFTLGGSEPGEGNVISGNAAGGVRVVGGNGHITANRIGTDASGARALPNGASAAAAHRDGITAESSYLFIGGFAPGGGNVISANPGHGVAIAGGGSTFHYNLIGTDLGGEVDLGNGGDGIRATAGGGASLYNNVVSGNALDGVHLEQGGVLQSNKIGTNAAGNRALGNGGDGLDMFSPNGWSDVSWNVISANGGHGVRFGGGHTLFGLMMRGNLVGTDVSGTLPLGNAGSGVYLTSRSFHVGGEGASSGNVISANGGDGITVAGTAGQPDVFKAKISSNRIGTNAAGDVAGSAAALGNRGHGIALIDAGLTFVGDESRGGPAFAQFSNTIAHNVGCGIIVTGTSHQVLVAPNRILDNGGMEIDLGGDGVTPNDPLDADAGPNDLQNFPVILSAASSPSPTSPLTARGTTEVRFTLSARPATTYAVDYYSVASVDPSGHGGSDRRLGSVQVTTDAAGNYAGTAVVDAALAGESVTATATDPQVNTSEFAASVAATVPDVTGAVRVLQRQPLRRERPGRQREGRRRHRGGQAGAAPGPDGDVCERDELRPRDQRGHHRPGPGGGGRDAVGGRLRVPRRKRRRPVRMGRGPRAVGGDGPPPGRAARHRPRHARLARRRERGRGNGRVAAGDGEGDGGHGLARAGRVLLRQPPRRDRRRRPALARGRGGLQRRAVAPGRRGRRGTVQLRLQPGRRAERPRPGRRTGECWENAGGADGAGGAGVLTSGTWGIAAPAAPAVVRADLKRRASGDGRAGPGFRTCLIASPRPRRLHRRGGRQRVEERPARAAEDQEAVVHVDHGQRALHRPADQQHQDEQDDRDDRQARVDGEVVPGAEVEDEAAERQGGGEQAVADPAVDAVAGAEPDVHPVRVAGADLADEPHDPEDRPDVGQEPGDGGAGVGLGLRQRDLHHRGGGLVALDAPPGQFGAPADE